MFLLCAQDPSEPVAANYYPITSAAFIRDVADSLQLSVLTDRSQGAASLKAGNIELMVHRRTMFDDRRGVDEPLNETTEGMSHGPSWERHGSGLTIRGSHVLLLSPVATSMRELRSLMDAQFFSKAVFISNLNSLKNRSNLKQAIIGLPSPLACEQLSPQLQILSLMHWGDNRILLRVGHQFAVGEDIYLSQKTSLDLSSLLEPLMATAVEETSLSANQYRSVMLASKVNWNTLSSDVPLKRNSHDSLPAGRVPIFPSKPLIIWFNPMQIRTFIVHINKQ